MPYFNVNDYVDVAARIQKFWELYPEGAIVTQFLSDPNDLAKILIQAEVYKKRPYSREEAPDATGLAFEIEGGSGANQTSHVENGETSAIGRALANLGLKTRPDEPRPSRQEMEKVNRQSTEPKPSGDGLASLFAKKS